MISVAVAESFRIPSEFATTRMRVVFERAALAPLLLGSVRCDRQRGAAARSQVVVTAPANPSPQRMPDNMAGIFISYRASGAASNYEMPQPHSTRIAP